MKPRIPLQIRIALALTILAGLTPLAFQGCVSTSTITTGTNGVSVTNVTSVLDTNKMVNAINIAVPLAVGRVVANDRPTAAYFQDAVLAINLAVGSGNITPAQIQAAVDSAGVNEIKTPDALSAIDAAVAIYQAAYSAQVNATVNSSQNLSVILQALAKAIQQGLSQ